jgi:hypothetical protein
VAGGAALTDVYTGVTNCWGDVEPNVETVRGVTDLVASAAYHLSSQELQQIH